MAGRYRALSLAEARAAAAEIVKADDLVWVVVRDRAKIEEGLRGHRIRTLEIWDEDGRPVG